jgi:hypothetical protein
MVMKTTMKRILRRTKMARKKVRGKMRRVALEAMMETATAA